MQLPEALARPRVRQRNASKDPGSEAIRSITRNAVESDATAPNSPSWSRAPEVRHALPAVGEHHRQVADHPARIMTTPPLLQAGQAQRQRPSEPNLSATCASSAVPACETRPAPSDVTSTVTERPSRITLKVNLQSSGSRTSTTQESLLSRTFPRPRSPRGRGTLLHAPG